MAQSILHQIDTRKVLSAGMSKVAEVCKTWGRPVGAGPESSSSGAKQRGASIDPPWKAAMKKLAFTLPLRSSADILKAEAILKPRPDQFQILCNVLRFILEVRKLWPSNIYKALKMSSGKEKSQRPPLFHSLHYTIFFIAGKLHHIKEARWYEEILPTKHSHQRAFLEV